MRLAVFPGDGIGPDFTDATVSILRFVRKKFYLPIEPLFAPIGLCAPCLFVG